MELNCLLPEFSFISDSYHGATFENGDMGGLEDTTLDDFSFKGSSFVNRVQSYVSIALPELVQDHCEMVQPPSVNTLNCATTPSTASDIGVPNISLYVRGIVVHL